MPVEHAPRGHVVHVRAVLVDLPRVSLGEELEQEPEGLPARQQPVVLARVVLAGPTRIDLEEGALAELQEGYQLLQKQAGTITGSVKGTNNSQKRGHT